MIETWKPIPGWEFYEVSDHGSVRSVPRTVATMRGRRMVEWNWQSKVIKQRDHNGYCMVTLSQNSVRRHAFVHVLVLEAFRGPCPDGMECLHDNGQRDDNRLVNLRWGTRSENRHDSVRHGTHQATRKLLCAKGHALEEIRPGRRGCKQCRREYQRDWARSKYGFLAR